VWTCAYTGRSGLTFEEAVDSEKKAKEQLEQFPQYLYRPLLCIAALTHRSRLIDMNDDVFLFAKDRFFVDEAVEVVVNSQRLIDSVSVFGSNFVAGLLLSLSGIKFSLSVWYGKIT